MYTRCNEIQTRIKIKEKVMKNKKTGKNKKNINNNS